MAAIIAAVWLVVRSGGILGITVFYIGLQMVLPLLGLAAAILLIVYAVATKHVSVPVLLTGALALIALWPALWLVGVAQIPYPVNARALEPTVTIEVPANEPLMVAWGGRRLVNNYHAWTPDQMLAYDLVAEPAFTGSANLTDYGCYGLDVLAPIAGEVVVAHDGEPDQVPGQLQINTAQPSGNHVVLELDTGTYLVIAHLKPGSVAVEPGDQVAVGDVLGQCGNSGNTSEPHVHIHHQRQDPREWPVNFAEGLPLEFEGIGVAQGGIRARGGEVEFFGETIQP
ncbi:MAG: M23 family metallopeptidase [Chloroflexi bacterium]|nr:M23 family metallopeptidase [Chloroflexota bacterium]